jgi:hypothetical protein
MQVPYAALVLRLDAVSGHKDNVICNTLLKLSTKRSITALQYFGLQDCIDDVLVPTLLHWLLCVYHHQRVLASQCTKTTPLYYRTQVVSACFSCLSRPQGFHIVEALAIAVSSIKHLRSVSLLSAYIY